MLAAESQGRSQRFRDFQFLFAGTLLHEAGGHVLTIFLNNGRVGTPAQVTVTGYGNQGTAEGESGRWLELNLFGGTSEYYRDPNQGAGQVSNQRPSCEPLFSVATGLIMRKTGIPHQIDASGWAWRIDPDTINRVVQYRKFHLQICPRRGFQADSKAQSLNSPSGESVTLWTREQCNKWVAILRKTLRRTVKGKCKRTWRTMPGQSIYADCAGTRSASVS